MSGAWLIQPGWPDRRRLAESHRASLAALQWLDIERVMRRSTGGGWPYGFVAVEGRDGGRFCGVCGLPQQRPEHGTEVEVGYHLLTALHGQGSQRSPCCTAGFRSYGISGLFRSSARTTSHDG